MMTQTNDRVIDRLRAMGQDKGALAAMEGHLVRELHDLAPAGAELTPITLRQEEGRRIYERTLRFVMLLAVRRLWGDVRVRVEYSAGHGVFIRLPGTVMDDARLASLEREMRAICAADVALTREVWPLQRCREWFASLGRQDKLDLLADRTVPTMAMYGARWQGVELWDYFNGAMASTCGTVSVFALDRQEDGFILYRAEASDPERPAPAADRPRLLEVFRQSADWCRILGVENVPDLTRMIRQKQLRGFIRVNEALQDQAIGDIARQIDAHGRRIVMVAGPSSSGKTTFAGRLCVHLRVLGHRATRLSLDDYYLDRDKIPRQPDGSLDLESIDTLDLPLLREHMHALLRGEEVQVPRFDFRAGKRAPVGTPLRLAEGDMIVIEGIHGLSPMLREGMPEDAVWCVFVSALTCLNLDDHERIRTTDARLLRRIVRDYLFRGTEPEETLAMWESVRRGEERWIFPYQELADSMFNTSLHYELPILAHYALPLLRDLDPACEGALNAARLRKALNYMPPIDEDLLT